MTHSHRRGNGELGGAVVYDQCLAPLPAGLQVDVVLGELVERQA